MCAMAYAEFQQELKKAQLTAREFARLIRMNESSITNYSSKGTVPSHLAVIAKLIGTMAAHEKAVVEEALRASGGRVAGPSGAAARLGLPRSTLESKIRLLKINKSRFRARAPKGA